MSYYPLRPVLLMYWTVPVASSSNPSTAKYEYKYTKVFELT